MYLLTVLSSHILLLIYETWVYTIEHLEKVKSWELLNLAYNLLEQIKYS